MIFFPKDCQLRFWIRNNKKSDYTYSEEPLFVKN